MIDMLAELDEGGRRAKETMKQVRDWEGGWYQESENAITELDRLIETWG